MQVYAIVAAVILAFGFFGGYKLRSLQDKATEVVLLKKERAKLAEVTQVNNDLFDALLAKQRENKVIYRTITKEIPRNVPKIQKVNSNCNISIATKRLLNELIQSTPNPKPKSSSRDR